MGLLLLLGTMLFFISSLPVLAGCLLLTVALYRVADIDARTLWTHFYPVAWLLLFVFVGQIIFNHWSSALAVVLRLIVLVLLATLVTLTTRTSDMMDTIVVVLRPVLSRGGRDKKGRGLFSTRLDLSPEKLSLMLMLTIRYIPMLFQQYMELRNAQRARGVNPGSVTLILPLLIRALRLTDQLAEAIDARAYESAEPGSQSK